MCLYPWEKQIGRSFFSHTSKVSLYLSSPSHLQTWNCKAFYSPKKNFYNFTLHVWVTKLQRWKSTEGKTDDIARYSRICEKSFEEGSLSLSLACCWLRYISLAKVSVPYWNIDPSSWSSTASHTLVKKEKALPWDLISMGSTSFDIPAEKI